LQIRNFYWRKFWNNKLHSERVFSLIVVKLLTDKFNKLKLQVACYLLLATEVNYWE